jgi:predicted nucleotidyltransferase
VTIEEIKSRIMPLLVEYEVEKAAVFGSTARGESTMESDIDLLVEFRGEKSLLDLAGLKLDLEELLHRKVDILTYDSLHPLLREGILSEQKALL